MVPRLKRSPGELCLQKQLLDEEGHATSKRREMRPRETPPQTPPHPNVGCGAVREAVGFKRV